MYFYIHIGCTFILFKKGHCYQVLDIFLGGIKPFTVIFYELPALNMILFMFLFFYFMKLQNWPMALLVKQMAEKKLFVGSTAP